MQQMQGTFIAIALFDFNRSLEFLGQFRPAMGELRTDGGVQANAISINATVVIFRVRSIEPMDASEFA